VPIFLTVLLTLLAFSDPGTVRDTDQNRRIVLSLSHHHHEFIPTADQLTAAAGLGISLYEVSTPDQVRAFPETATGTGFLLDIGPLYQVPGLLSNQSGQAAEEIQQKYRALRDQLPGEILAVGILRYPFESAPGYPSAVQDLADTLRPEIPEPFYIHSAGTSVRRPESVDFIAERVNARQTADVSRSVVRFYPSGDDYQTMNALNTTLEQLLAFDESILILPASWFFTQLESNRELQYLFKNHLEGKEVTLPLPAAGTPEPAANWTILLLLIVWGSFALHYRYQPVYSQALVRYFTNHSFFVDDVMEHRLRNALPGIYLLIQHALLTGLFVYASVEAAISPMGLDILSYYFPGLMIFESRMLSLFTAGVAVAMLLQTVSVTWIHCSNKKLTAFSQVLNLYSWPLHLNLIIVTFLIVFNQVGFSELYIFILAALFIVIWFFSFNMAAIDSSKFLDTGYSRSFFLLLTVGIHILLVVGLLIYIFFTPAILEPVLFALDVP